MSMERFAAAPKRSSDTATSLNELTTTPPSKTPIQVLHEYGIKTGSPPVYTLEKAEGQAHNPSFTFRVTIGEVSCLGDGSSKKVAKHKAAEAALNVLKGDANSNVETGFSTSKKTAKKMAAEKLYAKLKSIPADKINLSVKKPVGNNSGCTWDSLKNSSGEKINLLKKSALSVPNTDYVKMLTEVAEEQDFRVSYMDIEELSVNGQYQCLAELSSNPVTVCHGTGLSCGNAHNDAAHNALQYLKIMAGKK
ncbi:interferon-inducible double-stranded RNA-dependent protein kinase activator A [Anomaloglossus baeobatrachus]|uniref:interferon-inducible double-stranded RNA-dependent protein kinase activator A n=1 Tax=Anomaloglossus baeobatrachus TaxID=238106 RepID=UPI003F501E59